MSNARRTHDTAASKTASTPELDVDAITRINVPVVVGDEGLEPPTYRL
jgi:hypothetical protein